MRHNTNVDKKNQQKKPGYSRNQTFSKKIILRNHNFSCVNFAQETLKLGNVGENKQILKENERNA